PRLATDAHQRLLWSWNSDAFGVGPANPDVDGDGITTDIPLRFPGQLYDAHSALHYNYFRDYDPETGRYVESDPIGLRGGINTYGYVGGNPLLYIDPDGLIARYNGNDYQQWPTAGPGCEEPIWAGGYIIGWKPCEAEKKECPEDQVGDTPSPTTAPPFQPYQSPPMVVPPYVPTPYVRPSTPLTRFGSCVVGNYISIPNMVSTGLGYAGDKMTDVGETKGSLGFKGAAKTALTRLNYFGHAWNIVTCF
ncbi:RHS repeat-associated core domain-containing protein, partial [Pseudomonas indica]|uniref:RHS repeat-associated core domain-containing protein n=1 Tax=Pseudomonas indica TaxID=137658 RepID=UPI001140E073